MGIVSSVIDSLDSLMEAIGGGLRFGFADYCELETIDDENTLVSKDGALCTMIEVHGSQKLRSGSGAAQLVDQLVKSLQSSFGKSGHVIQAFFEIDHERTRPHLKMLQSANRNSIQRLELELDDLLDEREQVLSTWVAYERCYFALWTTADVLAKSEREEEKKLRAKNMKGKVITKYAQNPLAAISMIRGKHNSFVAQIIREMQSGQVVSNVMKAGQALREIRSSIDPSFTSPSWTPALPGDVMRPTVRYNQMGQEEWEIMWPRLGWQLCPRDAVISERNFVTIGERTYAPIYIDLFQKDPSRFASLFGRSLSTSIPWRVMFQIEGGGLDAFKFKGMAAGLMGMVGSGNKAIDRSLKNLASLQNDFKVPIVKVRCALATWAPSGDRDLLVSRSSTLSNIVESWGGCQVSQVTGDPIAGLVSTVPGMTLSNVGTKAAAPLEDALNMLPLTRPSSPWKDGSVLFRSPDGKMMPFSPYSSKQAFWVSVIFASPGSGKSVLMNTLNLALVLAAEGKVLPKIAVLDIGPSSGGLISLLKFALPPHRRHEVVHKRLRMVDSDAINPFDTLLGCRTPTSPHMEFLKNFMSLLMTEPGEDAPPPGMGSIIAEVLKDMYARTLDRGTAAKSYAVGIEPRVDDKLREFRVKVDAHTIWWEVVDALFENGAYYEAKLAQRHAVPLLSDSVTSVQDEKIKDALGDIVNRDTHETLIRTFSRQITTVLNLFPILSRPTAFDLGEARIAALDLDEVAKSGGPQADWQTGVLYMMARQIMAQDFYVKEELVVDMPVSRSYSLPDSVPVQKYKDYHEKLILEMKASPKRLCYDEFHRTSKCSAVREQIIVDMREGRKFQVDIMLASQSLSDFSPTMLELTSSVYILDKGNADTTEQICRTFGLTSDDERYAVQEQIRPPQKGGGIFMVQHKTTDGLFTILEANTLGPIELWAFSTTTSDVQIRELLSKKVGPVMARKALARMYPGGSAASDMQDRRTLMKETGVFLQGDDSLTDVIVRELEGVVRIIQKERDFA